MPRRNIKNRREPRAYHLFNQGAKDDEGQPRRVFLDREDKRYFLWLLSRHLGKRPKFDGRKRPYLHLRERIVLLAFNVMTTHFHLIVRQRAEDGIAVLMNRVKHSYTRYFNKKYGNTEPLFNGPVQSKPIKTREYFKWLVGYVHDNHPSGVDYEFSSHRAWIDSDQCADWLDPQPGLDVFGDVDEYAEYLVLRDKRKSLDRTLGLRGRNDRPRR